MSENGVIKIKRGFDIKLVGKTNPVIKDLPLSEIVAVKPTDFLEVIPKMLVQTGDEVKAGDHLFYEKDRPELKFTAPVSGEIVEIFRGEKRKILEVRILADKEQKYRDFSAGISQPWTRDSVTGVLLDSGAWNMIRQRPFSTIAKVDDNPKGIFISCFDSAPLAPDLNLVILQNKDAFETGIRVLQAFNVPIHLSLRNNVTGNEVFNSVKGVKIHYFEGPHPAGNVGIQIHHISPIRPGDVIWYLDPQQVVTIGNLFTSGSYKPERIVSLSGSEVKETAYYRTIIGNSYNAILEGNVNEGYNRYILGNVLTGQHVKAEGFIGFYDQQITVIPESSESEFLGWLMPGFNKLSLSRTFFSWLNKNKEYRLNSSQNGEERAFVVTGEYEKVLPMNILPVQLLKAILAKDIEMMEKLGIYEISEEDLALCEFVCTSKMPVQQIVSRGLELMRKEG
ncbi:MAG: Na(+)-translocating NADH-quinone reductase subunit A [Saprospiraceae bacterium]|nr:Na(+)-translocating NADH-quinone reductase subunit A [Saprospiraceae bacterium]